MMTIPLTITFNIFDIWGPTCTYKYQRLYFPYDKTNYDFYPARALRALGLLLASGQTATYWKTETIQSYLMIWGTYDPIEWGPSDP